ncbi:encapsulin-associated ferritin-like protein [Dongia deserti]|uniref:encapsulin-associated ferritin-like protein n=1 Tax=Dongia deserti TaxID=2268030 RepID=UPI000E64832F|nr:ferritin-like domain-containing protein [Dongia deserti]
MSSELLHEAAENLSPATIDRHRATVSLMEELEAIDWYDQRIDAATDQRLKEILRHNRDEEKEHAAMVLEWLRRQDPVLDEQLRTYLFKEGDILSVEAGAEAAEAVGAEAPDAADVSDGCLGIGDLRGEEVAP